MLYLCQVIKKWNIKYTQSDKLPCVERIICRGNDEFLWVINLGEDAICWGQMENLRIFMQKKPNVLVWLLLVAYMVQICYNGKNLLMQRQEEVCWTLF